MREGAQQLLGLGQADLGEQSQRFGPALSRSQHAMGLEDLDDLLADTLHRVERGHRLLEDHADRATADRPPFAIGTGGQRLPGQPDLAGADRKTLRQQPHHRMGGHRLAGAGFADDAERLAAPDFEADIANGMGTIAAARQRDGKIADGEDGLACRHHAHVRLPRRLGLKASFRPSPIRFRASTVTNIAVPGMKLIHHWSSTRLRPEPTI